LVKTVPCGFSGSILSTNVKVALPPAAKAALIHWTVPPAPTVGNGEQFQPTGDAKLTKVIPAGITSVSLAFAAASGPALEMVIV
jgi:hypothetical protein